MHPSIEVNWLDSRETVSLVELSRVCGMTTDDLAELVEYGALAPLESNTDETSFSAVYIVTLRTVSKLRTDFDLDVFTVAMLMGYLSRIDELERQVQSLRASARGPGKHTHNSEGHPS